MTVEGAVLQAADRVAERLGLFESPFSAEEMIGLARRRTGLSDFGAEPFEEGLRVLLEAYHREAELNLFGRFAARWDVLRFLTNLLRLRDAELRDPAILGQEIPRPIFISGLPRTGSSFFHNLLAQDPDTLAPFTWEMIYPEPLKALGRGGRDLRAEKVDRQIARFARVVPDLTKAHPMTAYSTQECTEITAHVFQSLRLDTTHHVPSYRRWLDRTGHRTAYRFHRRFLQHLQRQKGRGRWIVKCPDHLFTLEAIFEVYPDARFVFLHRDPVKVMASVAQLTEVVRRPFTRRLDPHALGRQVNEHWLAGVNLLVEADAKGLFRPGTVRHLEYSALVADPFRTVTELYAQFDMPLEGAAAARIKTFIAERPNGGYAPRVMRLEDYGLCAPELREAYRGYMDHFDIGAEDDSAGRTHSWHPSPQLAGAQR